MASGWAWHLHTDKPCKEMLTFSYGDRETCSLWEPLTFLTGLQMNHAEKAVFKSPAGQTYASDPAAQ